MIEEGKDKLEWYRQVDPTKLSTLKDLIMRLDQGDLECDPCKAQFLVLEAIRISGVHFSLDNRRLFCLKQHEEHQRLWQPGFRLLIRLRIVGTIENLHTMKHLQMWEAIETTIGNPHVIKQMHGCEPTRMDEAEWCTGKRRARKKKHGRRT